jgi:hypothetical protein
MPPVSNDRKVSPPAIQRSFVNIADRGGRIFVSTMPGKIAELSIVNIEGKQLFKTSFTGSFTMAAQKLGKDVCFAVVKTAQGSSFISKVMNLRK